MQALMELLRRPRRRRPFPGFSLCWFARGDNDRSFAGFFASCGMGESGGTSRCDHGQPIEKFRKTTFQAIRSEPTILPGCHRILCPDRNMADRLMQLEWTATCSRRSTIHGSPAAEIRIRSIRGWALIHNFAPCNPTTVIAIARRIVRCPAEWLNKPSMLRYHPENWLQNLI